ncbi:MAG: DMT family transporter [Pseudomonadota bacterium]
MPDPQIDQPATLEGSLLERWNALPGNVRGGIIFILAAVFFSVMVALIKIVGQRLHITEILLFRQLTMVLIAAPVLWAGWPESLHSARPKLQVVRVGLAFMAMTLGFSAIVALPLAEATVISFSKTFFTTVFAIFILGEVVRTPRWIAVVVGFVGILIIVWPALSSDYGIWHIAALASAVCVSLVFIIIRILSQVDQPVTILTYQAVGVGILMIAPAIWFWQTPTLAEFGLLVLIGVVSVVAQYLNILAMKAGEASALAPLEYTRLIFAAALGYFLFAEWPEPRVWVGAALIIAAALYVLYRERKVGSPSNM